MDHLYVVDAAADDDRDADGGPRLRIHLYAKTAAGDSVRLVVRGHELVFFVAAPERSSEARSWADFFDTQWGVSRAQVVRKTHLMGYEGHPANGDPATHAYIRIAVQSLAARGSLTSLRRRRDLVGNLNDFLEAQKDAHGDPMPFTWVEELVVWHDRIDPTQSFFVSRGGAPGMWCTVAGAVDAPDTVLFGTGPTTCLRDRVVDDPTAVAFATEDATPPPDLKILSFDIETGFVDVPTNAFPQWSDPNARIIQIGMTWHHQGVTRHQVLCNGDTGDCGGVEITCCDGEAALLDAFALAIQREDPDVVTGFNIFGFDIDWLWARYELIAAFHQFRGAELRRVWAEARHFVPAYMAATKVDALPHLLEELRAQIPPEVATTRGRPPPVYERLAKYRTAEDLERAAAYFGALAPCDHFLFCGRRTEVACTLSTSRSAKGFEMRRMDMEGRCTIDLYLYVQEHYQSAMKSFSLKNVALHFGISQKVDLGYFAMFDHWASGDPRRRSIVADYCSGDCKIPVELIQKLRVIVGLLELSRVTGVTARLLCSRGQQVRCYAQLYRLCVEKGMVMNVRRRAQAATYKGAIVQEPKAGYYRNIVVYEDFASLYPNVIRSNNLSYDTYVYPEDRERTAALEAAGKVEIIRIQGSEEEHWFVREREGEDRVGIVPLLLNRVLGARKRAKRDLKAAKAQLAAAAGDPAEQARLQLVCDVWDSKQKALKVTANSMYGFCGVPEKIALLPCLPIADSTTAKGREYITVCAELVPQRYPVTLIYGDTDSVIFVCNDVADLEQGYKIGTDIERWLNDEVLPPLGKYLSIECEEICSGYVQIKKKRYISRCYPAGPDGECHKEMKGIEPVRKDTLPLLNRMYTGCIDRLFPEDPKAPAKTKAQIAMDLSLYLSDQLNGIVRHEVPVALFQLSKTLRPFTQYKNPRSLPHVALAMRINEDIEMGKRARHKFRSGDRIDYVIGKGAGDVGSRVMLPEEATVATLDEAYYLASIRRSLDNLLKFFFSKAQLDTLFGSAEAVLRRRGVGVRGLAASTGFVDATAVLGAAAPPQPGKGGPKRQTRLAARPAAAANRPPPKKRRAGGQQRQLIGLRRGGGGGGGGGGLGGRKEGDPAPAAAAGGS